MGEWQTRARGHSFRRNKYRVVAGASVEIAGRAYSISMSIRDGCKPQRRVRFLTQRRRQRWPKQIERKRWLQLQGTRVVTKTASHRSVAASMGASDSCSAAQARNAGAVQSDVLKRVTSSVRLAFTSDWSLRKGCGRAAIWVCSRDTYAQCARVCYEHQEVQSAHRSDANRYVMGLLKVQETW